MPQKSVAPSESLVARKVYGAKPSTFVKAAPLTPEKQELRNQLNVVPTNQDGNYQAGVTVKPGSIPMVGELPSYPRVPQFRPDTNVIGSSVFANQVEDLMRVAPQLRGRVPKITQGWNQNYINDLLEGINQDGNDPDSLDEFYGMRTQGITNVRNREIAVSPFTGHGKTLKYHPDNAANTIAHEYGHVVGPSGIENTLTRPNASEDESDKIGNLAQKAFGPTLEKYYNLVRNRK